MRMFIFVFLVLMTACGNQNVNINPPKTYRVHATLEPYVRNFEALSVQTSNPAPIHHLIAEFKDLSFLGPRIIGVCYYPEGGKGTPIIQIDPDFWENGESPDRNHIKTFTPEEIKAAREFVMFHELGHCRLGENHRDNPDYPSIMDTYALSVEEYMWDYDFLIHELFDPPKYQLAEYTIIHSPYEETNYLYDPTTYASRTHGHENDERERLFIYKPSEISKITNL